MAREVREARKAAGLCTECGERPPRPGYRDCWPCARERRQRVREALRRDPQGNRDRAADHYQALKDAGLCPGCKGERDGKTLFCSKCKAIRAERNKVTYEKLKAAGKCTICGQPSPYAKCRLCRGVGKDRPAWGRKRKNAPLPQAPPPPGTGYRTRLRERIYAEEGIVICGTCCKFPATHGTRCASCQEEQRDLARKRINFQGRDHRCGLCGQVGHNRKTCQGRK